MSVRGWWAALRAVGGSLSALPCVLAVVGATGLLLGGPGAAQADSAPLGLVGNGAASRTVPLSIQNSGALTGAIAIPADVAFEPSEVTLQVTRGYEFFGGTTGDHQTVRLRGAGVSRLVESVGKLASGKKAPPPAQVLVADDAGHETLVGL